MVECQMQCGDERLILSGQFIRSFNAWVAAHHTTGAVALWVYLPCFLSTVLLHTVRLQFDYFICDKNPLSNASPRLVGGE